jgi:hypothetical protein
MSACARAILYVSSSAFMLLALGIQPMASNTAGMPWKARVSKAHSRRDVHNVYAPSFWNRF